MKCYFIHDGKRESGPFTLKEIMQQQLSEHTMVRHKDLDNWSTLEEFYQHIEQLKIINQPVTAPKKAPVKEQKQQRKRYLILFLALAGFFFLFFLSWRMYSSVPAASATVAAPPPPVQPQIAAVHSLPAAMPEAAPLQQPQPEPMPELAVTEKKPVRQNTVRVDERSKRIRKDWTRYISATNSNYAYSKLGGISDLSIVVNNNTDYPLDEVTVRVTYFKTGGGIWKTKNETLYNIPAYSEKKQPLPDVSRGRTVKVNVLTITSRKMNFCYNSGKKTGTAADPYFCR